MKTQSVVIGGVGGQGIVLASDILSEVLFRAGYDVKKNEIHGMSQREGSVVSFVRWGERVFSPVVSLGEADFLLAFEYLEGLRYLPYLCKGGVSIVSTQKIEPVPVKLGKASYPASQDELFLAQGKLISLPADILAKEVGNIKMVNTLLLGVLSCWIDCKEGLWEEVIGEMVKPESREPNMKAFKRGRSIGQESKA